MAAKARVRFSTSGASKVTGAFSKVGSSASGAGGKVGKFGTGIGSVFYKVMRNVGRITMFSAGLQKMGKSAGGAEQDVKGFADGSVTALSGLSKKFAELRRQYYFFKFAGQKIAAPFKWAAGKRETPKQEKGGSPVFSQSTSTQSDKTASREAAEAAARSKRREILSRKFRPSSDLAQETDKATTRWQRFLSTLMQGEGRLGSIARKVINLKNAVTVLATSFAAIAVAGGIAFVAIGYKTAQFAKTMITDFMSIREVFRQYEISLGGIIKNTFALGKMMKFATKYASEYPAMFEEVLGTFRSLAALPALKPMFRKADEKDLKNIMHIIQGLATLDPVQGVEGAGIALREALSGDMRSVRKRFEIPPQAVAEAGGYNLDEITKDSQKALKAFGAFIQLNVPAKAMADAAMTISIQIGNLRDKYRSFVNDIMKSTGAYYAVVTAVSNLNSWLTKVFDSPVTKQWAEEVGNNLRAFVATLEATLSGIDWKKYMDSGDLVSGLTEAAQRISVFLKAMVEQWKTPFTDAVSKISKVLWEGLIPVIGTLLKAIGIIFWEGMKKAAAAATQAFFNGLFRGALFTGIASFVINTVVSIGTIAGKAFMSAFFGTLNPVKAIKEAFKADMGALTDWMMPTSITPKIEDSGVSDSTNKAKQELDELKNSILETFGVKKGQASPEVVTSEYPMGEYKWRVKNLKEQLAVSNQIGTSLTRRKAIIHALVEAEKDLNKATAIKEWGVKYAPGRALALKQMEKYEAAVLKARKAEEHLGVPFYAQKQELQKILDRYDELYGKLVDQKSAFGDLVSMIKAATESLKPWSEKYKIGKKDAGALLIVVKKLQDVTEGRVTVQRDPFLDLLKKRAELTDTNIKKEKEYRKQLAQIPRSISQNIASVASSLQSSMISFADKLKGAFIGVGKYGGAEPDPLPRFDVKKKTKQQKREEFITQDIAKRKTAREEDFANTVLNKVGNQWAPKNLKSFIQSITSKLQVAGISPDDSAMGRKMMAEMRLALLERQIPMTKHRSSERADIYAKMAGAQRDIMQATVESALVDIHMQRDQLSELKNISKNTKDALSSSESVIQAVSDIASKAMETASGNTTTYGNQKISGSNPSVGALELALR